MDGSVEDANDLLRAAVASRIEAVKAGKPSEEWYEVAGVSSPRGQEQVFYGHGCVCSSQPCGNQPLDDSGQGEMLAGTVAFLGVLDELKALHLSKTQDYGDSDDALANIKNGSDMVGIAHWKGALVRAADKMQRLKTYCRNGRLVHEGVADTLLDLAAYAVLALVMFRDENP